MLCQTEGMACSETWLPLALVTTTVGQEDDARRIAQAVLQARLAACVQVDAITSHYRWQGMLHEEAEWRLVCKTTAPAASQLFDFLQAQHPYALPQLVVQPIQASAAYAHWVAQQVGAQNPG